MKKSFLIYLILFFIPFTSFTQKSNFVLGLVLNDKTNEPIPFATIFWKEMHLGCTSNENGTFRLHIDDLKTERTLIIRSLGYETIEIPLRKINPNKLTTFKLQEKVYSFNEVLIKGKKRRRPPSEEIVSKAIDKITDNYSANPFLLEGYYRDYIKIDNQYFNMYESLVELEDLGFLKPDYETSKIKKVYGRMNANFTVNPILSTDYKLKKIPGGFIGFKGGNELSILRYADPIRNYKRNNFDFINYLKTDFLKNHTFRLKEIAKENDDYIYVIHFKRAKKTVANQFTTPGSSNKAREIRKENTAAKVDGLIYIDLESHSIRKLIYALYLDISKRGLTKAWELNLAYKDLNNKSYLNYLSFNNVFEMPNYSDSTYFHLKTTHIEKDQNRIILEFNNPVNPSSLKKLKDPEIYYKNKRVKFISSAIDKRNDNMIILSFNNTDFINNFSKFDYSQSSSLKVILPKKLTDTNGNMIDDAKLLLGYQYREFFVNQVNLNFSPLKSKECISKWKSLINHMTVQIDDSKEILFNAPLLDNPNSLKNSVSSEKIK